MTVLQETWNPEKTWIFAVGILQWADAETFAAFPDAMPNRADQKLMDIFQLRGVPLEQICYLQDQEATLAKIQEKLPELLASVEEDGLFILYFAGHGDWDAETGQHFFINYDANSDDRDNYWAIATIFEEIAASFTGGGILLLADCCYSGGLVDEMQQHPLSAPVACITSAYAHNISTGQWTFTESLCKGWSGHPGVDLDGDGEISLYDLARYVELEMAFVESQKSMFLTTGSVDVQMQLALVTEKSTLELEQRVEVKWEDQWFKAITMQREDDKIWIRYIEDNSEELVEQQNVRFYQPQGLPVGASVSVSFEEEWYPATVKKFWYGLHFVSYDDYPDRWQEWVSNERLRSLE